MTRSHRGKQQAWAVSLRDDLTTDRDLPRPKRGTALSKVVTLWIPQQFVHPSGVDVRSFVSDANDKIVRRGFVLWDGQVLMTPIVDVPDAGILQPEVVEFNGYPMEKQLKIGEFSELIWERSSDAVPFQVPIRQDWQEPQRAFFGLENPYQMAENSGDYTWSHLMYVVVGPLLSSKERIVAIVHGDKDRYYFYCPCHTAEVVYTTRHRLLCMGCGATHVVLRKPLPLHPKALLTAEEWVEVFDENGGLRDVEIDIATIDFQDVENADTIWRTSQWDQAKHTFVFFARSSPEEIAEAIRGTEADASIFLEAGWTPVDTPAPPAHQVADDSIDVDLLHNAAHALREGVASFIAARNNSDRLMTAIPQLFKAVELMLKAKLEDSDPRGLDDHPNNPTVLRRLAEVGVMLSHDEAEAIGHLRRLRNDLQHGPAKFNHRRGLAISRRAIVFVDRFAEAELGLWLGDAIPPDGWSNLLAIDQIAGTAERVAGVRLMEIRQQPNATISLCVRCGRDAMVRPDPRTGASCVFCGHVPVDKEESEHER